jgi:poly(3-hydroxyalkanoate) synthetase
MKKSPAYLGLGLVENATHNPLYKTRDQWQKWADREAKKQGPIWTAVLCWVETRQAFRINFAGQWEIRP